MTPDCVGTHDMRLCEGCHRLAPPVRTNAAPGLQRPITPELRYLEKRWMCLSREPKQQQQR